MQSKKEKVCSPTLHFWSTVFASLLLRRYVVCEMQWETMDFFVAMIIMLANIVYCFCHTKRMIGRRIQIRYILFVVLMFLGFGVYVIYSKTLGRREVDLISIVIVAAFISPAAVSNKLMSHSVI